MVLSVIEEVLSGPAVLGVPGVLWKVLVILEKAVMGNREVQLDLKVVLLVILVVIQQWC